MLQKVIRRTFKRLVVFLLVIYILLGVAIYFNQEKLLFLPTTLPSDYQYKFSHAFNEVFIETNGGKINMIHFKCENPKGVILYFHGNAGDLSRWGIIAEGFVEKQYDVLIMDYRTYGKSTGVLSEQAFYSDALYCYDYLVKSYSENDIVVYGRSLGTGLATYVSSKRKPKQLILETPYYSITDVAQSRFPMYPVAWLLKYKFQSHKYLEDIQCSITIFHGTDDKVIPWSSAKKLYLASSKKTIELVKIEGGNHNNLNNFDSYRIKMTELLN